VNYPTKESLTPVENILGKADSLLNLFAYGLHWRAKNREVLLEAIVYLISMPFRDKDSILRQEKEKLLQETISKQNKMLELLSQKQKLNEKQLQEVINLNNQLKVIISKLESDIEAMKSEGLH
jgi:hypothetical protein